MEKRNKKILLEDLTNYEKQVFQLCAVIREAKTLGDAYHLLLAFITAQDKDLKI